MSKPEAKKYFVPVEITRHKPVNWLKFYYYEYKIYSDDTEVKHTKIKFTDIGGFIIGEHMPTKLNSLYDKVANQAKAGTVKAVTEIKNVVDGVADIAVIAAQEVKGDVAKTADIAVSVFGKIKSIAKDRFKKSAGQDSSPVEDPASKS